MGDELPELTLEHIRAALPGASAVQGFTLAVCDRPWANPAQAIVERVQLCHQAQGSVPSIIAKRARVSSTLKRSRQKADEKLRSFAVDAAFLRTVGPELRAACPALLTGTHDEADRTSLMLMTDIALEFPEQPEGLDRPRAMAALE